MEMDEMPGKKTEGLLEGTEQLEKNRERLELNLERLNSIPDEVLNSPEGQEEIKSLKQRIGEKFSGFRDRMIEKISYLSSDEGRTSMIGIIGVSMIAATVPSIIQAARIKWPEIGVALDAAPDALQQVIHMDLCSKILTVLGEVEEGGSIWQNSGVEVNNLLADISSGKESVESLSQEQLAILAEGITSTEDFDVLLHPDVKADEYASAISAVPTGARAFGNMGTVAGAGIAAGVTLTSVGAIASKFNKSK